MIEEKKGSKSPSSKICGKKWKR